MVSLLDHSIINFFVKNVNFLYVISVLFLLKIYLYIHYFLYELYHFDSLKLISAF